MSERKRRSTDTKEPDRGPGPDFPSEVGRLETLEPDTNYGLELEYLKPTPVVDQNYKVRYPYNKVTKYLAKHKLEFNNTPGNEYINLEHGSEACRMTMMGGGTMEIRQLGQGVGSLSAAEGSSGGGGSAGSSRVSSGTGNSGDSNFTFYHEIIQNDHGTEVKNGNIISVADRGIHLQKANEHFYVANEDVTIRAFSGDILIQTGFPGRGNGKEITLKSNDKIILDAPVVEVRGTLRVYGDLQVAGDIDKTSAKFGYGEAVGDITDQYSKEELAAEAQKQDDFGLIGDYQLLPNNLTAPSISTEATSNPSVPGSSSVG